MSGELAIGLILGLLMGAAAMGIFMGTVAHNNYERFKTARAEAFNMEEKWLDALEGNTDRQWMLKADGAEDPYVVRGRPDLSHATPEPVDADTIDLTWADE